MALRLRLLHRKGAASVWCRQRPIACLDTQENPTVVGASSSPIPIRRFQSVSLSQSLLRLPAPWNGHSQQRRDWTDEPQQPVRRERESGGRGRGEGRGGRGDGGRGGRRGRGGRGGRGNDRGGRGFQENRNEGGGRGRGRGRGPPGRGRGGRGVFERDSHEEDTKDVEKPTVNSITVAKTKGGGGGKYCYGCGATIVSKGEQEGNTVGGGGSSGGQGGKNAVSMGLKSYGGGYWQERKDEVKISKIKNWGLCARCKNLKKNKAPGDEQLAALSPSHEMTQIFREQVSKIRKKEDAVVVLCVDAVNVKGSLINTLRNYVGGNPILLAVTRCDLLPDYVTKEWSKSKERRLKEFFAKQAAHLRPADVYLCSVDEDNQYDNEFFNGTQKLANDLWHHLDGRDPYIVGAANLGKSTLTDRLIDELVYKAQGKNEDEDDYRSKKERKRRRYGDKSSGSVLDERRFEKILESRVTKSSLPGTTLQNVRVPCFIDHNQALWDTPGLLLDPSLSHFPIRNFRRIKAQRPNQIQPQFHEVNEKSFAFLVYDEDDGKIPLPLLRVEIRLKKEGGNDEDPGPVHLVWNSTLEVLSTNVRSIEEAVAAENKRMDVLENYEEAQKEKAQKEAEEREMNPEQVKSKDREQKKREYKERVKAEKKELGLEEWKRREEALKEQQLQTKRLKALAQLKKVSQEQLGPGKAMEIDIAHFGSLGILSPRTTLVRVFAPKTGIQITSDPAMSVPPQWEEFTFEPRGSQSSHGKEHDDFDEDSDDDFAGFDDDGFFDEQYAEYDEFEEYDEYGEFGGDYEWEDDLQDNSYQRDNSAYYKPDRKWTEFSGKSIGWEYAEMRYVRGDLVDGWFPIEVKKEEKKKQEEDMEHF